MSQSPSRAFQYRWLLLAAALFLWTLGIAWIFLVGDNGGKIWHFTTSTGLIGLLGVLKFEEGPYYAFAACYLAAFLLTQWLFLGPRKNWRIALAPTGRPMKQSLVIASLMAALLSIGLIAAVMEASGGWKQYFEWAEERLWPALLALGVAWTLWGVLFFLYWRQRDHLNWMGRILRGLIAGSIVELLISIGVHSASPNRKECYCATGSYTGLVFGATVLLWAFGPAIALLFLREKFRHDRAEGGGDAPQA